MKRMPILLRILTAGLLAATPAQATPYNDILPAIVTTSEGKAFWCNAYLQVRRECAATEINSEGFAVIIRSRPIPSW